MLLWKHGFELQNFVGFCRISRLFEVMNKIQISTKRIVHPVNTRRKLTYITPSNGALYCLAVISQQIQLVRWYGVKSNKMASSNNLETKTDNKKYNEMKKTELIKKS